MRRYSSEEKRKYVEDWKGKGKSAWAYAKGKGINPQTFNKWVKQKNAGARGFVELKIPEQEGVEGKREILIEKGELKIHVPLGIGQEEMETVMAALGVLA